MALPTINVTETTALQKAMQQNSPFYISNQNKKLLVYDPDMKKAADVIIKALERAESCKERLTEKEFWDGV